METLLQSVYPIYIIDSLGMARTRKGKTMKTRNAESAHWNGMRAVCVDDLRT